MSDLALLSERRGQTPRAVQIQFDEQALYLSGANGFSARIPFWKLFQDGEGPTRHIRRIDRRGWELRLSGGAHRELFDLIGKRPLASAARPVQRLGGLKVAVAMIVILVTIGDAIPSRWTSKLIPEVAQRRMVDGYVGSTARLRCNRQGGEEAAKKILARLDPAIGDDVEIIALSSGTVLVTSLPGRKLLIMRGALGDVDAEALAALLAHELSHIRHGDTIAAMVRYEGFLGAMAAIIQGHDRRDAFMEFSGEEEERADREANAMMQRARITMKPAARMFAEMRTDEYFARSQRDFHFGMPNRAQAWERAAQAEPRILPALLRPDEADNLFNFCWPGRIKTYPTLPPEALKPTLPPGTMKLNNADKQP